VAAAGSPARGVSALFSSCLPLPGSAAGSRGRGEQWGRPRGSWREGSARFPGGGAGAALPCGACAAAGLARPQASAGLDFRAPPGGRELRGRRRGAGGPRRVGGEAASPQAAAAEGQAAFCVRPAPAVAFPRALRGWKNSGGEGGGNNVAPPVPAGGGEGGDAPPSIPSPPLPELPLFCPRRLREARWLPAPLRGGRALLKPGGF